MSVPPTSLPDALDTVAHERAAIVDAMIANGIAFGRELALKQGDANVARLLREQQELARRYDALGGEVTP